MAKKSSSKKVEKTKKFEEVEVMDDFKSFLSKYWGGLLGAVIALLLACTPFYRLIIAVVFVGIGFFVGNYIQSNKKAVKTKLKSIIDKM